MRLFGKKRLTEKGLADAVVSKVGKDIYGNWSAIRDRIREPLGSGPIKGIPKRALA